MASYRYRTPRFPRLHRCKWCRKRLNKDMQIVAAEYFDGEGSSVDGWFCDRECARAEHDFERIQRMRIERLNEFVEGKYNG